MLRPAPEWVLAVAAFLALPPTVVAADDQSPETFGDAIAALEKADPGSPETLNDRLEYARFLIDAADVDCHQRLDTAQSQLDTVAGTAAVAVVLPNGRARVADIQYRVKLARASCVAEPAERESDLREALAAAEQAVDLYRDALDYQSMTVMQFNIAATQRLLGENDASVASLESVVAMDREFGFRQDAEDNAKLLVLWKGSQPATPTADFPVRAVALKFAWAATDATLGIEIDHAAVLDGNIVHGRAYRLFKQHVHAGRDGWVVSYEPGQIAYDVAAWPIEPGDARDLAYSFGRALPLPGFEINATPQAASLVALVRYVDRELGGHPKMQTHFWATTYMRIVTDPNTLTTYLYDERRYWHAAGGLGEDNPYKPQNHSERLVSTFTYP